MQHVDAMMQCFEFYYPSKMLQILIKKFWNLNLNFEPCEFFDVICLEYIIVHRASHFLYLNL